MPDPLYACTDRICWWVCARRTSMVLMNEIPRLPPILRASAVIPETSLFFSCGTPTYDIKLIGTKRNGMPSTITTRQLAASQKLMPRYKPPILQIPSVSRLKPIVIISRGSTFWPI